MTIPLYALIGFVFWTVFLVLAIGASRVSQVVAGKAGPTSFPAGQPHGTDMYWRLNRAHLNCIENIPLFAAVVLAGHVSGHSAGSFATLAQVYMAARVAQSLTHISSGSVVAINVRFGFFATQIVCLLTMAVKIVNG